MQRWAYMNARLITRAKEWTQEQPWELYATQIFVLMRNEIRRNLFTRRRLWVYLLAAIPVVILLVQRAFARNTAEPFYIESATRVLARIVHLYYVRLGIFFACMGIFTWLFRGEMVERTLHYQFLVPVRREVQRSRKQRWQLTSPPGIPPCP